MELEVKMRGGVGLEGKEEEEEEPYLVLGRSMSPRRSTGGSTIPLLTPSVYRR